MVPPNEWTTSIPLIHCFLLCLLPFVHELYSSWPLKSYLLTIKRPSLLLFLPRSEHCIMSPSFHLPPQLSVLTVPATVKVDGWKILAKNFLTEIAFGQREPFHPKSLLRPRDLLHPRTGEWRTLSLALLSEVNTILKFIYLHKWPWILFNKNWENHYCTHLLCYYNVLSPGNLVSLSIDRN